MAAGGPGRSIMTERPMKSGLYFGSLLLLSAVFLYSFVTKILDPEYFVMTVSYYRLFPGQILHMAAIYLIMLEGVVAVSLWIPRFRRSAALILGLLLVFFIAIILISVMRGLDISCGCFGHESGKVGMLKAGEDLLLLAMAWGVFSGSHKYE